MDYESFSPMADKIVHSDGSITTFAGDVIAPPSAEGVALYESMLPTKDGFLQPDGSIKQLADIIGSTNSSKIFITDIFFDCKDRVSSLTNDLGIDGDRALVRNSNDSVFYIYTKISGAWVQGDVYMTFDETNGKYFRVTNDSASMGAVIFEAYSSSSHYFTPLAGDAYDDMYNGVNKYTIGAGGVRQKLYNAIDDIVQKEYLDEKIADIQTSNFCISDAKASDAVKQVSIPAITSLKVGQVIYVQPINTNTLNDYKLKLNNFDAYPVWYRGANQSVVYINTWEAGITVRFIFTGTAWEVDAQIRRAVTTEWIAGTNTRPSSITPNQLYNVITNRLAADQYSNFVISNAPSSDVVKQISIPTITSLNVGQVIFVMPTISSAGNAQNLSIKLNDFDAYPVRIRGNVPVAVTGTYLMWSANVLSCYVFTGSYWDCIYTPPGGSASTLTAGSSSAIYMWTAKVLSDYRKQYIPDLPTTGSYTLKCVDGVPQWVAE